MNFDPPGFTVPSNDFSVTPGHLNLSQKNHESAQWRNDSGELVMVLIQNDPVGFQVAAGQFSSSFSVCPSCQAGTYDYSILRLVNGAWVAATSDTGPPTVPDIIVGD